MVEVVRDEGGALQEAEHVSRQRALEAAPVNPSRVLIRQTKQVYVSYDKVIPYSRYHIYVLLWHVRHVDFLTPTRTAPRTKCWSLPLV